MVKEWMIVVTSDLAALDDPEILPVMVKREAPPLNSYDAPPRT